MSEFRPSSCEIPKTGTARYSCVGFLSQIFHATLKLTTPGQMRAVWRPALTVADQMIHLCIMSAKVETTRDSLVEAAIRVLSARPAATLSDIARAAGVKRVTLHRLLGTRDELLKEIAIRSLAEMDEACRNAAQNTKSALEALRASVAALVPVGDRCHFLWAQAEVWEEPTVAKEVARQHEELSQLIDGAKAEGSIQSDLPNSWVIAAIEAIVFAALTTARAGDIAVNDAGKLAVTTLFAGIERRPSRRSRRDRE